MQRNLDYVSAHTFVEDYKGPSDVFWDGWDICIFAKNAKAAKNKHGMFRKGNWGFTSRFAPDDQGIWRVNVQR